MSEPYTPTPCDCASTGRIWCCMPDRHYQPSKPYTPTTDEVRAWAVLASPLTEAEFDRWLASEKAKAWDEGYVSGATRVLRRWSDEPDLPDVNPYREQP